MVRDKDLLERTKRYALNIIKLVAFFPHNRDANIIGTQLSKVGTSVGANYREANRARSKAQLVGDIEGIRNCFR